MPRLIRVSGRNEGVFLLITMVRAQNSREALPRPTTRLLTWPGECKDVMNTYLGCLKKVGGTNDDSCRNIAKSYLACRMERQGYPLVSLPVVPRKRRVRG